MPPHPYTFNHDHLRAIETAALAACKDPLKPPSHEEAEAFAVSLPATHPHVASATYNRAMRRIEVKLHGGIGFPVPLRTEALPEKALWAEAIAAYEAIHGTTPSVLHAAAEGHRNARHIAVAELAEATGCPCGEDEVCADEIDTPERVRLRNALTALVSVIGVPERVERGNSPP